MSQSARAVARPENRVWKIFSVPQKSASEIASQPVDTRQENPGYGYDFASGVRIYLYCQADPVNHIDPSGNSVYVCTRPLNIPGLSVLAPAFNHFFLAFDTDGITNTADLNKWTSVVESGNNGVSGQYPNVNYSNDPYLTTFSFHPYSVYSGKGEKDELSVFATTGSYVAYNDNIDHNAFLQAQGGGIRNGRHLVTSDLNEQIKLYNLARASRDKNNSGSPDAHPYAALNYDCASWTYTITHERGGLPFPVFPLVNLGVGIHGPFSPIGTGVTALLQGFHPQFDQQTGGIDVFNWGF